MSEAAQKLHDLINSQPSSPTVAEIDAVLGSSREPRKVIGVALLDSEIAGSDFKDAGPDVHSIITNKAWELLPGDVTKITVNILSYTELRAYDGVICTAAVFEAIEQTG